MSKRLPLVALAVLGLVGLGLAVGCGGPTRPKTAKVTGTVKLDGTAVEGASVFFQPKGEGGRPASGTTDASGRYSLTTFEKDDGALVGEHAVAISKVKGGAVAGDPTKPGLSGPGAVAAKVEYLIPQKFSSTSSSGLTKKVDAGSNTIDFDLGSK